jgi:hypothetical protein
MVITWLAFGLIHFLEEDSLQGIGFQADGRSFCTRPKTSYS